MRALLLALACSLAGCACLLAPAAQADRAFAPRFAEMARGDVWIASNTLMTCPGNSSTCSNAKAGTGSSVNNEDFTMTYVDVDSDATTFDSSRSDVTLPAGSTVLFAGLYWGADTSAGGSGAVAPNAAIKNQVKLKVAGSSSYSTVTASQIDTDSARATRYQGFADVTSQVQAAGNGTYAVANVQAGTGTDRYAGWSLVVAYKDPSRNVNWIAVYDGFGSIGFGGGASSLDLALTGFQTPAAGTVNASFGMVSYEGELGYTGDTATLNGVSLVDAVHPSGNYFNSSISRLGVPVSTKSPNYVNQLGFDANRMNVDGFLTPGSTSATAHVASPLDMIVPGVITLVTDEVATAPAVTQAPAVSGSLVDGQTLTVSDGTWSGTTPMTFAYQWQRCDAAGNNCADIPGATSSTYQLTSSDIGSTFRGTVTATNVVDSASSTSGTSGVVGPAPPVNTALPTISGTPRDTQTLTADRGTWTGTPVIAYAYQWRRCDSSGSNCSDVNGAASATYQLTPSDVGSTMRVVVTGTNAGGSGSATSAQTAVIDADPAVNTGLPTISGTATDGQTLTGGVGGWTGTPTIAYSYQWQRCDASGNNCSDVSGATSSTYQLTSADVGSTMRLVVTGTNAGGSDSATSSQTVTVAPAPPVNTALPAISGTTTDGQTLNATTGTWTGTPTITYAYQWRRCDSSGASCVDLSGATSSTYQLVSADVGSTIRVVVTATNVAGTASATSSQTAVVAAAPPVNSVPPTVTGTARDGQTLTGSTGIWTGTPTITYGYQWRRCSSIGASCTNIAGATSATYQLVAADVGSTIRLVVTGTNAGGNSSSTSTQTAVVAADPPANTALPTISGTTTTGQTLTANRGTWTGTPAIAYTYQWRRCDSSGASCSDIPGATAQTYQLTYADADSTMRVAVTGTNAGGSASSTSAQTAVIAMPPVNTVAPAVSGTLTDGQTLTGSTGAWAGTAPISFSYQWRRCNSSGTSCSNIAGATSSTYQLTPGDIGSTIRLAVTGTNGVGSGASSSSATAPVAAIPVQNSGAPTLSGTTTDGQTLTVSNGSWTGSPTITYSYQWQRCDADGTNCVDIAGATGSTYDLTSADVGRTVRAEVTATNAAGPVTVASAASGVIDPVAPANTGPPSISGTTADGSTLTADPGDWDGTTPITSSYQWQRCDADGTNCVDIAGATGSTYRLTGDDIGHEIVVVVTASNQVDDVTVASSPTSAVTVALPQNGVRPTIGGDPDVGGTLTADPGTWTGPGPITYEYQWLRCDSSGSNCEEITGATDSTYVVTGDDADSRIRVEVTAQNPGGAVSGTSEETDAVGSGGNDGGDGGGDDLGGIPGSLVGPSSCQRVLAGTGFKHQRVKGVGKIGVKVQASEYISPSRPLKVTAKIPRKKVRSLVYILDKRPLSRPKKAPYLLRVKPKVFAKPGKHSLALKVKPRKGRSHRMTLHITTAPCTNVLSAFQWRTSGGTGLRLRIDSRVAMRSAKFKVPSAMLPKAADAGKRAIGTAVIYLGGGRKVHFDLKLKKGDRSATLVRAAPNKPRIVLTKKGVEVSGLPGRTGILEVTLYTRNKTSPHALLRKRTKAKIRATALEGRKRVSLSTIVRAQRH